MQPICTKICLVVAVLDMCKVLGMKVPGVRFYRGSNFHFFIDSCFGLTTVQRYCATCDNLVVSACNCVVVIHINDFRLDLVM